jgi:hypothetical protein
MLNTDESCSTNTRPLSPLFQNLINDSLQKFNCNVLLKF